MPDHFQKIYAERAADYDRLVQREDYEGNLPATLQSIARLDRAVIADLGTGTGRVMRMVAPYAAAVIALDVSAHMLRAAAASSQAMHLTNCRFVVVDSRDLPLVSASVDVAIEGWSFGHLTGWHPDTWQSEIRRALREMKRIVKPGGMMILIETLGTGRETPLPPTPDLAAFYQMLETEREFHGKAIRTDYRFETPQEAVELSTFFFGEAMSQHLKDGTLLPECTGVWWRQV